jgi:hypothetical protein
MHEVLAHVAHACTVQQQSLVPGSGVRPTQFKAWKNHAQALILTFMADPGTALHGTISARNTSWFACESPWRMRTA